jgi:hypothetical protein
MLRRTNFNPKNVRSAINGGGVLLMHHSSNASLVALLR